MDRKHIHETNPKRTAIALVIFVVIIIIGLITIRNPRLTYSLDPNQTVELAVMDEHGFFPYDLEDVINGNNDTIILIDIRNKFIYGQGHIPGSENISAYTLLENDNIRRLKQLKEDGLTVVIYGEDQLEANGPWMVFQQLGFDNIKYLYGGYQYYNMWKDSLRNSYTDDGYMKGFPRVDYAEIATSKNTMGRDEETPAPVTVKRKKKSTVAEGGC